MNPKEAEKIFERASKLYSVKLKVQDLMRQIDEAQILLTKLREELMLTNREENAAMKDLVTICTPESGV